MSRPSLLVGGTKVLERAVQTALGEAPVLLGTPEEALARLPSVPGAVVILGPTMKRALAAVAQIRPEGASTPQVVVVFRDEQKEDVKRHQRGKTVADRYVAQSRVPQELTQALVSLGEGRPAPVAEAELEEISVDVLLEEDDEVMDLQADDLMELEPVATPQSSEILGELDVTELEGDDVVESLAAEALEPLEDEAELEAEISLDAGDVVEEAEESGEDVTLSTDDAELLDDDELLQDDEETLETVEALEEMVDEAVLEELTPEPEVLPTEPMAKPPVAHDQAELAALHGKLAKADAHIAELQGQKAGLAEEVAALREAVRTHAAETAALTEQLKSTRAQLGALQTKVVDARIQAQEAAGIVQAIAAKLG